MIASGKSAAALLLFLAVIASGATSRAGGDADDALPVGAVARMGDMRFAASRTPNAVSFSADGKRIATSDSDLGVLIWDALTGKRLRSIERERDSASSGVVFLKSDR